MSRRPSHFFTSTSPTKVSSEDIIHWVSVSEVSLEGWVSVKLDFTVKKEFPIVHGLIESDGRTPFNLIPVLLVTWFWPCSTLWTKHCPRNIVYDLCPRDVPPFFRYQGTGVPRMLTSSFLSIIRLFNVLVYILMSTLFTRLPRQVVRTFHLFHLSRIRPFHLFCRDSYSAKLTPDSTHP